MAGVVTVAFAGDPAAVGLSVTITLAARIVPAGKFVPVRPMRVTPGSAAAGAGVGVRVTATGAWGRASRTPQNNSARSSRIWRVVTDLGMWVQVFFCGARRLRCAAHAISSKAVNSTNLPLAGSGVMTVEVPDTWIRELSMSAESVVPMDGRRSTSIEGELDVKVAPFANRNERGEMVAVNSAESNV